MQNLCRLYVSTEHRLTERGDFVVTHGTHIQEISASIPGVGQPEYGFFGVSYGLEGEFRIGISYSPCSNISVHGLKCLCSL